MGDSNSGSLPPDLDDGTVDQLEDAAETIQESVDQVRGSHKESLMRWIGEALPTPAPLPAERPATIVQEEFERGGYAIPIYQSVALTEKNDRWPEYVVAGNLAAALDDTKRNYRILYGFDPLEPPTEDPYSEDPSLLEWFGESIDRPVDGHVNLLLTDQDGGGVTGANDCLAGTSALVPGSDPRRAGRDDEARHQYAALHEVGHALGVPGDADDQPYRKPTLTLGDAWVENDRWHKTLVCSDETGGTNACGESIAPRNDRPVVYHNRYSECARRKFVPPEDLAAEHGVDRSPE